MRRWEATDKNGRIVNENEVNWELVKDKVNCLQLNNNGQIITLPQNMEYVQGKTASAFLGSEKIQIESRFLGMVVGNKIIKVRVNEKTNNISIEIEDEPNHIFNTK